MWKLEREEDYFRIYDSKKDIAGYFDPDYGKLFPREKEEEIIDQMHKNHDKISGGFLMLPMIKFGIFGSENVVDIDELKSSLDSVMERLDKWKKFISESGNEIHSIQVSHTDQDMLSVTFPLRFKKPTPLERKLILEEIVSILDSLQKQGLL